MSDVGCCCVASAAALLLLLLLLPVNSWERNSRIVHAISGTDPLGLYYRQSEVWRVFASEPDVALAPTGEAVMWFSMNHDGSMPPGGSECTEGCTNGATTKRCNSNYMRGQSFTTYLSWTLDPDFTQWAQPVVIQEGTPISQDTNMAAVILSNGSVVGLWRSKQYGGLHRVTATHWRDPRSYQWREHERALLPVADHPLAPEVRLCHVPCSVLHATRSSKSRLIPCVQLY